MVRTFLGRVGGAARLGLGLAGKAPLFLRQFTFPRSAERTLEGFRRGSPTPADYEALVRYFGAAWLTYRTPNGAGARFPGLPSWSGEECDALEGFSRMMPLFGAWCSAGRVQELEVSPGRRLSLPAEFRRGLLAGTDPKSPGYWGDMPGKSNQRIVEAADVALALWLFRDSVWSSLEASQRDAVVAWLALVSGRPGLDNNWHLFFVLIDRVLDALGYPGRIADARAHFDRVKTFCQEGGWFADGPGGRIDFYNAWGFHYVLGWIDRIDPAWDPDFIRPVQAQFVNEYQYLLGPHGLPILGRSIHYRLAVAAPLVMAADEVGGSIAPGLARRALDVTWAHFIGRGALRRGRFTQGYYGFDPRVIDPYAGPASSLWSLRSLIPAIAYPPDHPFWTVPAEPLPVELGDYERLLAGPGWRVSGTQATGAIALEVLANPVGAAPGLQPFSGLVVWKNFAHGRPMRPKNVEAKYGRRIYRSDVPFCG